MGRAIDMENRQDALEHRLKLVEDALEEMIQTRVHHVDLTDINNVKAEGVEVKPDEEFTPPTGKRKKTSKSKDAVVA
jgi:GDP-D-mannose dehydratase